MIEMIMEGKYPIRPIVFIFLFILALSLRSLAASQLSIIDYEAVTLLNLTRVLNTSENNGSFLYQIYFKLIDCIFGKNIFWLRFLSVLSGSLLILLPMCYQKYIGVKGSIWLAFFLTIDPFLTANSIIIDGNTLAILFAGLLILNVQKKNFTRSFFLYILLLFSGRGAVYFSAIAGLVILLLILSQRDKIKDFFENLQATEGNKIKKFDLLIVIFILISIILIVPYDISQIFSGILFFIHNLGMPYTTGNYPFVYPLALMSYIPLAIISMIIYGSDLVIYFKELFIVLLTLLASSLIIILYPAHSYFDLVWISIPLWILSSFLLGKQKFLLDKKKQLFVLLTLIALVSIMLNCLSMMRNLNLGIAITDQLLSIILITSLIFVSIIFLSYISSISYASKIVRSSLLILFLLFQVAIFFRSAGMTGKPWQEILWNGYFKDEEIITHLFNDLRDDHLGTSGRIPVVFTSSSNPALIWYFSDEEIMIDSRFTKLKTPPVIFTNSEEIITQRGNYIGQEFIVESYPIWTWRPFLSFFAVDYWSWVFWRDAEPYEEFHSMLVSSDLFYTTMDLGDTIIE